ncbi:unnamed protein product, partial [Brenthis ino]
MDGNKGNLKVAPVTVKLRSNTRLSWYTMSKEKSMFVDGHIIKVRQMDCVKEDMFITSTHSELLVKAVCTKMMVVKVLLCQPHLAWDKDNMKI